MSNMKVFPNATPNHTKLHDIYAEWVETFQPAAKQQVDICRDTVSLIIMSAAEFVSCVV